MPTRERGRPARTLAQHNFAYLGHLDRPVAAPGVSLGLAVAVHAEEPAACLQSCPDAPQTPSRKEIRMRAGRPRSRVGIPLGRLVLMKQLHTVSRLRPRC